MGFFYAVALAGHVAVFALPALAAVVWLVIGAVRQGRRPGFWALSATIACLLAAACIAAVVVPYRGEPTAGVWTSRFHLLFNLPLAAAGVAVAVFALLSGVMALRRRVARPAWMAASVLGAFASFPLYSAVAVLWPTGAFAAVGVSLVY